MKLLTMAAAAMATALSATCTSSSGIFGMKSAIGSKIASPTPPKIGTLQTQIQTP